MLLIKQLLEKGLDISDNILYIFKMSLQYLANGNMSPSNRQAFVSHKARVTSLVM